MHPLQLIELSYKAEWSIFLPEGLFQITHIGQTYKLVVCRLNLWKSLRRDLKVNCRLETITVLYFLGWDENQQWLSFDKHNGRLSRLVDIGSVNHVIEKNVVSKWSGNMHQTYWSGLIFMARAVFKPTLAVPISHYFSSNLTGIRIGVAMLEFMHQCNEVQSIQCICVCAL